MRGLRLSREIESEIQKISDSDLFFVKDLHSSSRYQEKISELDTFYENTSKMIKSLNSLINEMNKKIEGKDESKGKWEMYLFLNKKPQKFLKFFEERSKISSQKPILY